MNPIHRAAERLHAGHWRTARTAARWARTHPIHAAGAAIIGTPAAWRIAADQPKMLATLPAAWLWASWRTPTAPTSDDSGEKGPGGGGGEGMSITNATRITTTQGVCYATDDPNQPGYTRIHWETPWEKAPAAAYEPPPN